ncbi:hypothetical protein RY831_32265 [Noviherbaspirillum sp. CPCC 100848]|uniref:Response regulatory domain-containing protein n=1 Tax=Noviherbaspirillum album TaxID=3080276 RepID=A0ABU6JJF7_9BURK|nr:hypothetical protein [Noviherbaspirillum sp. CPCC 100848]MEC4723796.1 hypothetical protein [Noviherbaspirillum sp. CPCC 100848]
MLTQQNLMVRGEEQTVSLSRLEFIFTSTEIPQRAMEAKPDPRPWQPKPFLVAVLDSDEYLADTLCERLQSIGFDASAYYDIDVLMQARRHTSYDAYVLDYLTDWLPPSSALETLIASIRDGHNGDVPIFILGNQVAPERIDGLGYILMHLKVRYLLKPIDITYFARRIAEAVIKRAGL